MRALLLVLALSAPAAAHAQDRRPLWGEALWLTAAGAIPLAVGGQLVIQPDETFGGASVAAVVIALGAIGAGLGATALALDPSLPRSGAERQIVEALLLCSTGVEVFATLLPLTVALFAPSPPTRDGSELLGPIAGVVLESASGIAALLGAAVAIDGVVDLHVTPTPAGALLTVRGAL